MMNDAVREELQSKIMPGSSRRVPAQTPPAPQLMPVAPRRSMIAPPPAMAAPPPIKRHETSDLVSPKTSPTLVGFQNKNAALPDWRIQLQNAVQQRKGGYVDAIAVTPSNDGTQFPTNGGAALKAEIVPRAQPTPAPEISDPRVASAMRRINESRNTFLDTEKKTPVPKPARPYRFEVVATNGHASTAAAPARINPPPKPTLVSSPPVAEKRDTNKLPPINVRQETAIEIAEPIIKKGDAGTLPSEFAEIKRIRIRAENSEILELATPDASADEIEDLAQFSTRFGAGLFDLIIAAFASMLILSPVAFTNGEWFTMAGLLTFAGTSAIVMFLYMTICLGFFGKTMGMRLFSLELVDAVENEYPTLHQAAVNSSVFILSLAFAGAGFLTVFFNEENRALHDLLSGTILVREF